jgi:NAD(P)-dependent dehydrogenase (short-subunit alcohol dehydrogenase family)
MKSVVITGVTGTLGGALAEIYAERGWWVTGVSRQPGAKQEACSRLRVNAQRSEADARALLEESADVVILCAGQIESELGEGGMPLADATRSIYEINAVFPSLVAVVAAEQKRERPLDVVAIGSIADGSPSVFGPVYHASKIALHYFYTGVSPIARRADPRLRLRLYRPGVIRGPLSWAPLNRLNERGRRIRARRCESAPEPREVARRIADWVDGDAWVGSFDEPLSFRALRVLFALAPGATRRLQDWAWRHGSRFA